jgi:hypothetical protein
VAHEDLIRLGVALPFAVAVAACAGGAPPPPRPAPTPAVAAEESPVLEDPPAGSLDRLPRFHSKRFDLSLPLPDGKAWRIDDHTRPELVAVHPPTRATLVVSVTREEGLMDHATCEARARANKLVPGGVRTVEDHTGIELDEFDTRVWVGLEPPASPGAPLVGHVLAFGGFLRKCVFFHYTSEVATADDEAELATRLALARTRIFEGMSLDPFRAVPREDAPAGQGR